jgi:hypothetical protein
LFGLSGLLVSLPAKELRDFAPSGSVFGTAELRDVLISDELRSALDLTQQVCARQRTRLLSVVRPEIFTHGATLEWLRGRLGGIQDHLCISDGTAVRPIPELRNHIFLYGLGKHEHAIAFKRLSHWAPELLAGMDSQVNTCLSFRVGRKLISPPSVLVQVAERNVGLPSPRYFIYGRGASIEISVERTVAKEAQLNRLARNCRHITYVPMTETALLDRTFATAVARAISRSYSEPSRCVLLRLPRLAAAAGTVQDRLKATLEALRAAGLKHPRVPSSSLMFVTADPAAASLAALSASLDLLMHPSFEFWCHPRDYYDAFQGLLVFDSTASNPNRVALHDLLTSAFGRRPELRPATKPPAARRTAV